jgi:hypothetical protein
MSWFTDMFRWATPAPTMCDRIGHEFDVYNRFRRNNPDDVFGKVYVCRRCGKKVEI